MKNLFIKNQSGFTLVELLIVIAILGVLATAVLAAINPVEQINRGRDAGSQADAEELLGAISRFNAAQGYFPWQADANAFAGVGMLDATHATQTKVNGSTNASPLGWLVHDDTGAETISGSPVTVLSKLGSLVGGTNELQQGFIAKITGGAYNQLYVYNGGAQGNSTYVCFTPKSQSFIAQARKRWNNGVDCAGIAGTAGGCANTCLGVPADLQFSGSSVGDNAWKSGAANRTICDTVTSDNHNTMYCLP